MLSHEINQVTFHIDKNLHTFNSISKETDVSHVNENQKSITENMSFSPHEVHEEISKNFYAQRLVDKMRHMFGSFKTSVTFPTDLTKQQGQTSAEFLSATILLDEYNDQYIKRLITNKKKDLKMNSVKSNLNKNYHSPSQVEAVTRYTSRASSSFCQENSFIPNDNQGNFIAIAEVFAPKIRGLTNIVHHFSKGNVDQGQVLVLRGISQLGFENGMLIFEAFNSLFYSNAISNMDEFDSMNLIKDDTNDSSDPSVLTTYPSIISDIQMLPYCRATQSANDEQMQIISNSNGCQSSCLINGAGGNSVNNANNNSILDNGVNSILTLPSVDDLKPSSVTFIVFKSKALLDAIFDNLPRIGNKGTKRQMTIRGYNVQLHRFTYC